MLPSLNKVFQFNSIHSTHVSLHDYRLLKYEYSDLLYLQICLSNIKTYIKTYIHTTKLIRNNQTSFYLQRNA